MKLHEIINALKLTVASGGPGPERNVTGGYQSDLLSDVMGHSAAGNIWITLQVHANIVAVAVLKDLAAIILVNNREPDAETLAKARENKVTILISAEPAFQVAGKLYALGVGKED